MTKPKFDLMKWWPLLSAIVALIAASALSYYRIDKLEQTTTRQWQLITESNKDISALKERCARLER